MADLKTEQQRDGGLRTGSTPKGDPAHTGHGAKADSPEPATRGTDRDVDRSGESKNQGHGHPREERGSHHR
jgi:hypothetical protein